MSPTTQTASAPSFAAALRAVPALRSLDDAAVHRLSRYLAMRSFPTSARVIGEGEPGRDLYFVLSGEARVRRDGLEVARARPGDFFGELGLLADAPRAATVEATTVLETATLSGERFDALCTDDPALALVLVRTLVRGLRARLTEVTQRLGTLVHDRTLRRELEVRVRIGDETRSVRAGTPAAELLPAAADGRPVVAASIDQRAVSLGTPITSDCSLAPLTTAHWEGGRIWERSLGLLLLEAARDLAGGARVRLGPSVGYGQAIEIDPPPADPGALARELLDRMRRLVAENRASREETWAVGEARAHFLRNGATDAAELLRFWMHPSVQLQSWGEVDAIACGPIVPRAGVLDGFQLLVAGECLLLVFGRGAASRARATLYPGDAHAACEALAAQRHAEAMTRDHGRWLETLGITSVGELGRACVDGNVSELVRVAEGFHEKRFSAIADAIRGRGPGLKIVSVAGPSSSGKTTFIKRLRVQLQVDGIRPVGLSLDDYFVDRDDTPRDETGELDFEAFAALDGPRLHDHLRRLLDGERVRTSRYDFQTKRGIRDGGPEIALGPRAVLMVEGLHALNPRLLESVPREQVFRVYVCPLTQLPFDHASRIHASDVRLLRRIVRDRHGRGATAAENILRWPSVRRGERRHIFAHQHEADAVFDSSLIYELCVLRVFAERYLLEVPPDHEAGPTAHRLLDLLSRFVTIYPDHVPPTSILREFIGGSGFEH